MTRQRRPQQLTGYMDGYTNTPSLEAACQALEARLNEDRPARWADAIARLPFSEIERWSD